MVLAVAALLSLLVFLVKIIDRRALNDHFRFRDAGHSSQPVRPRMGAGQLPGFFLVGAVSNPL